jgi:DNA uptake protein ComE-like DNA-binding protein
MSATDTATEQEKLMATRVRVNLANEQELLELPGVGPAHAAAIIKFRSAHGPIKDADQLAAILVGLPLDEALREHADFAPSDSTAPEAPGA